MTAQLDIERHLRRDTLPPKASAPASGDSSASFYQHGSLTITRYASDLVRWERGVARLRQRVQEVKELLREDLADLEEPLAALAHNQEALSATRLAQIVAARAAYESLLQQYACALDALLQPLEGGQQESEQDCAETLCIETR